MAHRNLYVNVVSNKFNRLDKFWHMSQSSLLSSPGPFDELLPIIAILYLHRPDIAVFAHKLDDLTDIAWLIRVKRFPADVQSVFSSCLNHGFIDVAFISEANLIETLLFRMECEDGVVALVFGAIRIFDEGLGGNEL